MRTKLLSLGFVGVLAAVVLGGSAAAVQPGWGKAIEVPGTASLNSGGYAAVNSVSCGAASACVAGGFYKDASSHIQAFVVSEKHGHWGQAIEVPGTAVLNSGGNAEVTSVSCSTAGACTAGGWYWDALDHYQAFVVSESHGRWGRAVKVPGMAALSDSDAEVNSVSCAAAGACVAGGSYTSFAGHEQAFVVSETDGRWGHAIRVRGTVTLNRGTSARVNSVSCGAVRACVAGGHYWDGSGHGQAFVESLGKFGHWGWAVEVPGTAALNRGDAEVSSVSCAGAGACAAGGYYTSGSGYDRAFVVSETHGRWGQAVEVRRTVALYSGSARVTSVSCAAAGVCVAGGYFTDLSLDRQAFVVSSKDGRWGRAVAVPGSGDAEVSSVSCGAAGECVAGGRFMDAFGHFQAFVVSETDGHWGHAIKVPGTAALNRGDAQVNAISCDAVGPCAAGGSYQDGSGGYQAFGVTRR